MTLRTGITTGTCAAAAAKAATIALSGGPCSNTVRIVLPSGQPVVVPINRVEPLPDEVAFRAVVRKDAGDDPDVTDRMEIHAVVRWNGGNDVTFAAGEGVGIVTRPGLQIPPGEPAINPVPRQMVRDAIRTITPRGVRVEVAIPGGREAAEQTFNPRLGIVGGLSILGTSGIVRPYCRKAMHDALICGLDVAEASRVHALAVVPGNIGARAAGHLFSISPEQLLEVGNEWGFVLDQLPSRSFRSLLMLGHPGKLAKLAAGGWDTHSRRSRAAVESVRQVCREVLCCKPPTSPTVEGLLASLALAERNRLAGVLARRIRQAVRERIGLAPTAAVVLINMAGQCLAADGDTDSWT